MARFEHTLVSSAAGLAAIGLAVATLATGLAAAANGSAARAEPTPNPAPITVPAVRNWDGGTGSWELSARTRITVDPKDSRLLRPVAVLLAQEIADQEDVPRPQVTSARPAPDDVSLSLHADLDGVPGPEGYRLDVGDTVTITATERDSDLNHL